MTAPFNFRLSPGSLPVFPADQWGVVTGVNEGDGLGLAEDIVLEDCYELSKLAQHQMLALTTSANGDYRVAPFSQAGTPGALIHHDATLTFMTFDGAVFEALVLAEISGCAASPRVYLAPLARRIETGPYCLIDLRRGDTKTAFAKAASIFPDAGTTFNAISRKHRDASKAR